MDGSDRGTPNPLNPMSGSAGDTDVPKSNMPEIPTATPAQTMPEFKEPAPRPMNHGVVDPMMRSVAHHDNPTPTTPTAAPDVTVEETFDSLTMDDNSLNMVAQDITTTTGPSRAEVVQTETIDTDLSGLSTPNLVAKDSVVEPVGKKGGKKKALMIGAIVLLAIAIICGAAAVAIIMINNSGDRVSKAIEKVINGEMPSIISAQGKIETSSEETAVYIQPSTEVFAKSTVIDFNGTFDTSSGMNKISADIAMDFGSGVNIPLSVSEMSNKTGDTYFKISGLSKILSNFGGNVNATDTTTDVTAANCIDDVDCTGELCTNCAGTTAGCTYEECNPTTTANILSVYSGLLEVADNNWILITSDFSENMEDLGLFNNPSVCLINAFSTLPSYSKDIISKYRANPFVESSTDNLGIASKGNTLYRLTFNNDKLSAFANSLGNNGFVNELNACVGTYASGDGTSATMIEQTFDQFPALYAEIDDNNNFTRFYFQVNTEEGVTSSTTTADISLSYPKEFKLTEPTEYITMSELLNNVMSSLITTDATANDTSN